ncbi:hypothetical protein ACEWY4_019035 [Coilia grayii]|uniref:Chemokine interleukin-8-like domain-containing protein n=1 Tax=Coilia grayii TaxID=363190 RepID=A0ABD1JEX6_9TELE
MDGVLRVLYICLVSGLFFATLGRGKVSTTCCLRTSQRVIPLKNIKDYHMQRVGLCPVDAVVFTTVKGIKLCLDPKNLWVIKAVKYLDSKKNRGTTATA